MEPGHEEFIKSVAAHKMTVVMSQGNCRHIAFMNPETTNMHFNLTTWPGHLCISGDMETFVFNRLDDMFNFFRRSIHYPDCIDECYWYEKLVSVSRFVPAKRFSYETFEKTVKDEFRVACIDGAIELKKRKDVWEDVKIFILSADTDESAHMAASDFESNGFQFIDFGEYDLTEFTYHFIWCLRAIVWGIREFDDHCKEGGYELL